MNTTEDAGPRVARDPWSGLEDSRLRNLDGPSDAQAEPQVVSVVTQTVSPATTTPVRGAFRLMVAITFRA
jgi:hypothetical protein